MSDPRDLPPSYFAEIYGRAPDPWEFETSAYERRKYEATVAALPRRSYACGFEVGCSLGVLTLKLAERCTRLLAVDVVAAPLETAKARCRDCRGVDFRLMAVPAELPDETFDLIMLSEVAYYWTAPTLDRMIDWTQHHLRASGNVVLVHWTKATDYPLTGDFVHDRFIRTGLDLITESREPSYRLTVLQQG